MSAIKTLANDNSVEDFINSLEGEEKKTDAFRLLKIYEKATNENPVMWGSSIVGFGKYHYKSARSSQEGDWPLAAFSPRKQSLTLYVMNAGIDYNDLRARLGKHKASKACLYINKLADIDLSILEQLVKRSYQDAKKTLF